MCVCLFVLTMFTVQLLYSLCEVRCAGAGAGGGVYAGLSSLVSWFLLTRTLTLHLSLLS